MNFMISLLGWFLWNWAEFSITKEEGDGSIYVPRMTKLVNDLPLSQPDKDTFLSKIVDVFRNPLSLKEYARTHYETWVGSFATIFLLLWIGYRNLSLDPFEVVIGAKLGWNDLYLLGSGFAWDGFIFGFKWVKNFFKKKTDKL